MAHRGAPRAAADPEPDQGSGGETLFPVVSRAGPDRADPGGPHALRGPAPSSRRTAGRL